MAPSSKAPGASESVVFLRRRPPAQAELPLAALRSPPPASPAPVAPPAPATKQPVGTAAAIDAGWTTSGRKPNLTAQARQLMQAAQKDPDSPLNTKLRMAGISKPPMLFCDSFALIGRPTRLEGLAPEQLEKALAEVLDFAADHYVAHGGKGSPFFRTIELTTEQEGESLQDRLLHDDQLTLKMGDSLVVEIPQNLVTLGRVKPLTAEQLHAQWNEGRQFSDETLVQLWPLVNPTGEARTTLRQLVGDAAERLGIDLEALRRKLGSGDSAEARRAVRAIIDEQIPASTLTRSGSGTLRQAAYGAADRASNAQLAEMVGGWASTMADPTFRGDIVGQVVDVAIDAQPQVRSRAFGVLVGVANAHRADIGADVTIGANSVRRFLSKPAGGGEVDVLATGLFAVATHDAIDVRATITKLNAPVAQALAAASLERAFSL
jgi:hypothetical protein